MKILVVDDSTLMRKSIRTILEQHGYEVLEAKDGQEALQSILKHKESLALITLDVEMPNFNGFETAKALHTEKYQKVFASKTGRPIPIVFITGNDTLEDRLKGFEVGAIDFISKSFLEIELLPTVDKILKPTERLKGLCALVVDDSMTYRKIIADTLSQEGVSVKEAENGEIAFQLLKANPDDFQMMIVDLEMPKMNGLELTHKVRGLGLNDIPILILSGTSEQTTQLELFKAGVNDYITKPFIQEELLARLKVQLDAIFYNRELKSSLINLKKSQDDLIQSNNERMELLHVLCHDLANPLSAVAGILDLLKDDPEANFGGFGDMMVNSVNNGLEIIDMVRLMRALEEEKLVWSRSRLSLRAAVDESIEMLQQRFQNKGITLDINIPDDIEVNVEPVSFKNSILNNIFTNAIKFSEKNAAINVAAEKSQGLISLSIRDYGIGMPESLLADVFDVNKATSRQGTDGEAGTGFGMPLVKKFVTANEGTITVYSKTSDVSPDDHGTEVVITLLDDFSE